MKNIGRHIVATNLVCLAYCLTSVNAQAAEIEILPKTIELTGSSTQKVLLERIDNDVHTGEVTDGVQWTSSNPSIVEIEDGRVIPISNGTTSILATASGLSANRQANASRKVTVSHFEDNLPIEFRRHVLPVLSKAGCNTGACHGALAGKGGFKLSLRGYDPIGDHFAMTRQARGRRIEFSDPGRSLVLAKPSGAIAHKGGLRLDTKSDDYELIADWIGTGAPAPSSEDARLVKLDAFPSSVRLQPGDSQHLVVQATYDDGRIEDVTRWVRFSSANETVAKVSDNGQVDVIGRGAGAVLCWFSSQIVLCRLTVPYEKIDSEPVRDFASRNFVDDLVAKKLVELNLQFSSRCDDATFVRRVFLDTIGTLPTPEAVDEFLNSDSPSKRDELIDSLLARDEFVDYWTYRWSDLFLVNGKRLRPKSVSTYYKWIREHVSRNTPWDEIVREVVTSTGSSHEMGATNFFALHQSPEDMAENVSQAFLGLSIGCAKCHNHPLEKWTNDQYYAMANLFSRVRAKGWGGDGRNGDGLRTLYLASTGELTQPLTGMPQRPTPLDGEPLEFDDPSDRRVHLAKWLTAPENPYFGRSITNRVWASFMGVGLVEQVDDMRMSNPASHEELLDALAEFLASEKYNLKSLMRIILQSETYQRSSQPTDANRNDQRFYSRYYPRRLMAEVLLDAIAQVTDVPSEFKQIGYDGMDFQETKDYPVGTRAIQLHDSAVVSEFLAKFGRNKRDIVCECERTSKPSMVQVLHISNGSTINDRLKSDKNCVSRSLKDNDELLIRTAFKRTLSRTPSDDELRQTKEIFAASDDKDRKEIAEDLYWSLMSSREFLFNH